MALNFTPEEVKNLVVFIEAGCRAIASQTPVSQCANVFAVAAALTEKVNMLPQQEKTTDVL